jgi:hypothetical protein
LSRIYGWSLFTIEHQVNAIASVVLNTQTNKNGLDGPSQLMRLKLKIRIKTPVVSMARKYLRVKALIFW